MLAEAGAVPTPKQGRARKEKTQGARPKDDPKARFRHAWTRGAMAGSEGRGQEGRRHYMATVEARPPVQPGDQAPDFTLPAAHREGFVSLADYRGRSPVLLALLRGLY